MSSVVPISLRDPFWDDPHFSSSRQEFEEMRRQMMREAKDFWSKVDEDDLQMQRRIGESSSSPMPRSTFTSSSSTTTSSQGNNPATSVPRWFMRTSDTWTPSTYNSRDSQVIKMKEDENKFEITLDVHNFRPEELKVRTQPDNTIVIEGKHEEKSGDSGSPSAFDRGVTTSRRSFNSVVQHFSRRYSLPAECDPLRVVSNLSRDGVLVVTAPKTRKTAIERERNIPIPITR